MKIKVRNSCDEFESYRAQRVKSLFNCESGANFSLDAELPLDGDDWSIGVIVGPSGSGKTSIGKTVWPDVDIYDSDKGWGDGPIIDEILPDGKFDGVTSALSSVGLGSVPSWLKPYKVLSNGEKFRAGLARLVAENNDKIIIDEFTSVIDRQVAKIGAAAFSKAWKRKGGKAILLSCHYDVLDWLEPDWVFDTSTGVLQRGSLWQRPKINLEIFKTDGSHWAAFEPHYYLKLNKMIAATYYVGFVDGEQVAHICTSPMLNAKAMRMSRMVVMPEWQGAGVGTKFLDMVARMQFDESINRFHNRISSVHFHTSHPQLCSVLRYSKKWAQMSQMLGGAGVGRTKSSNNGTVGKYGGHLRAVQGFKMTRAMAKL